MRNIFLFSFLGIIGLIAFIFGNYLATTSETTQLSEASEVVRCGYIGGKCIKLDPGIFGDTTNIPTNAQCINQNGSCAEVNIEHAPKKELAVPSASPASGTKFKSKLDIELSGEYPEGTEIYYKIDSGKYEKYNLPFTIDKSSSIKVKAVNGEVSSEIFELEYIQDPLFEEDKTSYLKFMCSQDNATVKLSWDFPDSFKYYRLMVDRGGNGLTPFDLKSLDKDMILESNDTLINITSGIEYKKWGVVGANSLNDIVVDIDNPLIAWGDSFVCGSDLNDFNIYLPELVNNSQLVIEGTKEYNVKILVNSQDVNTKSEVEWTKEIELTEGINNVEISVILSENNTKKLNYRVNYCRRADFNCDTKIDISDFLYLLFGMNDFQQNNRLMNVTSSLVDLSSEDEGQPDEKINLYDFLIFQKLYSNSE